MSDAAPEGWLSIADLAKKRGVSKAAISKRLARFEREGLVATRKVGRKKLLHEELFDRACAHRTDIIRQQNGTSKKRRQAEAEVRRDDLDDAASLVAARARELAREAALDEIGLLPSTNGKLVALDVARAIARASDNIAAELHQMLDELEAMPDARDVRDKTNGAAN